MPQQHKATSTRPATHQETTMPADVAQVQTIDILAGLSGGGATSTADAAQYAREHAMINFIMKNYPDYQSFTEKDYQRFPDGGLTTILGKFGRGITDAPLLVPDSFKARYGEAAPAYVVLAAMKAADARGKPELYAAAQLNGGLNTAGKATKPVLSNDVAVTYQDTTTGKSGQTTAPRLMHLAIAQDIASQMQSGQNTSTITVQVPAGVIPAVVKANAGILPPEMAKSNFEFTMDSMMAFEAGYASRSGASNDIAPITMQYPSQAVCALPKVLEQIGSNPSSVGVATAYAVGYVASDLDHMPASQALAAKQNCTAKAVNR